MKDKKIILSNLIAFVLMMILLGVYTYTYHQLQASYGIGLYFALKTNSENRLIFDIGADVVRVGILLILMLVPSISTHDFSAIQLLRRIALIVAVAPTISLGCFIGIFKEMKVGIADDTLLHVMSYTNLFKYVLPLTLIFLIAACAIDEKNKLKKYIPFCIIALISFLLSLLVNKFYEPGVYLTFYCFMFILIDIGETIIRIKPHFTKFDALYLFFYLSGIYKLINIAINTRF